VLDDHLHLLRRGGRQGLRHIDLQQQALAVVGPQAEAVAVLLGEAYGIEHRVGLGGIVRGPTVAPFGPGVFWRGFRTHDRAGGAQAQPERLVQLVPVNAERQRPAKVGRCDPLLDLPVLAVSMIEHEGRITAIEAQIEMDLVVAALRVLQEDRQLGEVDEALHVVVFAPGRPQVHDLRVLDQGHQDPVDKRSWLPSVSTL